MTAQLKRRISTLHRVNIQYTHQTPLHVDSAWRYRFVFYLDTKWFTVEVIKLPCLDYVVNNKKRGEVKSVLLHPRHDRELIYVADVPFNPYHGGPNGLQDCFQYRNGKL